jgi:hypothetical protein
MMLSSGKLQFWEWKSPLLVWEHFVPRPCHFTFLHAVNVFWNGGKQNTSMGEGQDVPAPTGGFSFSSTAIFQRKASLFIFWVLFHTR